jgi:NTE family protein
VQTRMLGRAGAFQPRLPALPLGGAISLYDLAPLRTRLGRFIDFDRLNSGDIRVSVVATDIETGEEMVFDTGRRDRIGPDHLVASCGFLPDFCTIEIDGRLLGDGGLVANAPIESLLLGRRGADILCFVLDLFCAVGSRPTTLEEAAARRWDLMFGNQSRQTLKGLEREYRLRSLLRDVAARLGADEARRAELAPVLAEALEHTVTVLHLTYRAPAHEAGPEKAFDFSQATIDERWQAGAVDMGEAIGVAGTARPRAGISVREIRR